MNRRILALDPGTRNTGYAVLVEKDSWWRLIEAGVIPSEGETSMEKISSVLRGIKQVATGLYPQINELWVELYVPFSNRSQMMECISLVGGIFSLGILLPRGKGRGKLATKFSTYGIESHRWKKKLKSDKKLSLQDIYYEIKRLGVDITGVEDQAFNPHTWDAVGVGLYAIDNKGEYSRQWTMV